MFRAGIAHSVQYNVQTGSGAHQASHPVGSRLLSMAVKHLRQEADHTHNHVVLRLRMHGGILPLPHSFAGTIVPLFVYDKKV
jgi:hypothetical protein